MWTQNTGVVYSIASCVTIKAQLVWKATGKHLIKTQSPVWFLSSVQCSCWYSDKICTNSLNQLRVSYKNYCPDLLKEEALCSFMFTLTTSGIFCIFSSYRLTFRGHWWSARPFPWIECSHVHWIHRLLCYGNLYKVFWSLQEKADESLM